jgi:beta-N-acetylhexosaminidase
VTAVEQLLAGLSLRDKIGQLIMHVVYGQSAAVADDRNTALHGVATPAEVVATHRLGGVIYFAWSDNTSHPQQIGRLSNDLQAAVPRTDTAGEPIPLLIGADQETGRVARVGPPATQFPGAMALGATFDPELTREAYAITGAELKAVGINCDFAPDADVNSNPANPVIGIRSFSSEPDVVADHVRAAITGLQQDADVAAAAKHFPGHGDTGIDSHHAMPVINRDEAEWLAADAWPFRAAIASGADMIMTGHLAFPELDPSGAPATLSGPILTGLLRDRLGYPGVIITDSLRMRGVRELYGDDEVAVAALEAGVDILLMPADPAAAIGAITDAVHSGRLSEERIDASVRRILELKHRRGLFSRPHTDPETISTVVGHHDHLSRASEITAAGITVIRDDRELLPLRRGSVAVLGADAEPVARVSAAIKRHGGQVSDLATGENPDRELIGTARALVADCDQVVILTNGGWRSRGQRTLVRTVRESVPRLILAAIGDPYDAGLVAHGGTMLLSYSSTPVAVDVLTEVLLGLRRPGGRLPVAVGDDPQRPLFPFGAGLL